MLGLDLADAMKLGSLLAEHDDVARKAKIILNKISTYQKSLSALEVCKKPVIAAVHSVCIGGGVNLIASADIRYCSKDAYFQIKEVKMYIFPDF